MHFGHATNHDSDSSSKLLLGRLAHLAYDFALDLVMDLVFDLIWHYHGDMHPSTICSICYHHRPNRLLYILNPVSNRTNQQISAFDRTVS